MFGNLALSVCTVTVLGLIISDTALQTGGNPQKLRPANMCRRCASGLQVDVFSVLTLTLTGILGDSSRNPTRLQTMVQTNTPSVPFAVRVLGGVAIRDAKRIWVNL